MNLLKTFWICCFIAVPNIILSQVSQPLNVGGAGDYLGWDATVSDDLRIRHEGTRPIIFSTNNTERMRVFNGNTAIGTTIVPSGIWC